MTVGYGYDLGQQTTSSARELLSAYYSNAQVERLVTAIGEKVIMLGQLFMGW
ncbi:hypothetical protein NB16F74_47710 [Escherichia coli]